MMDFWSQKYGLYVLYAALAGYILIIFAPALIFGMKGGYDVVHHMSWYMSFRDEISFESLYPRWLTTQYNGLGAPALYFYPPFTTYFYFLVDSLTFFTLSPDHLLALSAFLLCLLSGGTFYLWAKIHVTPSLAIIFSALYMIMPYHLLMNFYWRAAMAEFAAYLWIPLIFAATYYSVTSPKARWILILSLSVAGLFLTHLLSALIVGPMVAIYAFFLIKKEKGIATKDGLKHIFSLGIYALLGVGVAAIYFLPAITLMEHISPEALHRKKIEDSYIYKVLFEELHNHGSRQRTSSFALLYLLIGFYLLFELIRLKAKSLTEISHVPLYWIGVVIVSFILMCGFVGILFQDPSPYKNIQFLTRLLLIVEFAIISAFMIVVGHTVSYPKALKRCVLIVGGLFSLLIFFQLYDVADRSRGITHKAGPSEWSQVQKRMSPDEYFPAGFDYATDPRGESFITQHTSSHNTAIITQGSGEIIKASKKRSNFIIETKAETPTKVQLKQFYFPGWEAHNNDGEKIALTKSPDNFMIEIDLTSGHHSVVVSRAPLKIEYIGRVLSITSILLLLCLVYLARRREN